MEPRSLNRASQLNLVGGNVVISDRVGGSNRVDSFNFELKSRSTLNLRVGNLQKKVLLRLLKGSGEIKRASSQGRFATINGVLLEAGSYSFRVSPLRVRDRTKYKLQMTVIPDRAWRVSYFNMAGTAASTEPLGFSNNFSRLWGTNSPSGVSRDNFTARFTTQRNLTPGLYKFQFNADDGIRVSVGNQVIFDYWNAPLAEHTRFFYLPGGETPISVDYREDTGEASIRFDMIPVSQIQESVDPATNWVAEVYSWNDPSGKPPAKFNIYNNKIGVVNLGLNSRPDGWKGASFDLGKGALKREIDRLPDDLFALTSYTRSDFTGEKYKFRVKADDGFRLSARNIATNQWTYITPENEWQEAYGYREIEYALPRGQYELHYAFFEAGGDANFDLSWGKFAAPSQSGLNLIARFERVEGNLGLYRDGDEWAIGFGHVIYDEAELAEYQRNGITEEKAYELLKNDAAGAAQAVNQLVTVPLSQNQFDALVSFTFNVGAGNLRKSALLEQLNLGRYDQVPNELNRWVRGNDGRVLKGLEDRRRKEGELFMKP